MFMFDEAIDPPKKTEIVGPSDVSTPDPPTQPGDLDGECPPEGPWSDPDCPGVQWVREVLTRAGFAITGDTGSALVARGEGSSFYMHAFTDKRRNPPAHLVLEEKVDGPKIYSRDITLWWEIQGLSVWLQTGPSDKALLPQDEELRALVLFSKSVEYDAAP